MNPATAAPGVELPKLKVPPEMTVMSSAGAYVKSDAVKCGCLCQV